MPRDLWWSCGDVVSYERGTFSDALSPLQGILESKPGTPAAAHAPSPKGASEPEVYQEHWFGPAAARWDIKVHNPNHNPFNMGVS